MGILSPDQKDVNTIAAASKEVIQDAIGETQRVIVQPLTEAITNALTQAAAQMQPAAQEFHEALKDLPRIAGEAAGKMLDEVEGLTVTATVTLTVTRKQQ